MADMESNEKLNVNMIKFLLLCLSVSTVNGRIHTLSIEHDGRKEITVSTFGFLSGGTLAVNITSFSVKPPIGPRKTNTTLFGFTLDKSKSPGLSSYMEGMQETCILNNPTVRNENMESIFFHFDLKQNRMRIERVGDDMKKLVISNKPRDDFLIAHDLSRRATGKEELYSKLTDHYLVGSRRKVRAVPAPDPVTPSKNGHDLTGTVEEGGASNAGIESPPVDKGVQKQTSPSTVVAPASQPVSADQKDKDSSDTELQSVDLTLKEDGTYQGYFLVYIKKPEEEGLYNLFFHNCLSYTTEAANAVISLSMKISEDNNGNFLTAGEMPVPALYYTFSVLFFITGIVWLSILRRSKEDVFKIHYLMLVVVFVKSLSCLFHGVNMYFIQRNGIHEEAWAVLWYIVYLTRGALMFVTVLLIGAGWAFIKHVLTDKEKKLFLIVIPLQVLDRVAEVIVEESEEGNQSYMTWKEIFILVDLLCCGAILFPVVWSIRHLQEASRTDGKAAINLQKLKLFRHFYIMVVCYIYFTRIIVYLMKITLPFKLEWLTELFTELAMLVFFILTGSKFRPATDNPYLQVPLDSDEEEEIEMEEVLTKTGSTSGAVRVNQRTEGTTNHIRAHENSHEYD